MLRLLTVLSVIFCFTFTSQAQSSYTAKDSLIFKQIFDLSLSQGHAYPRLGELCKSIGPRLSGSDAAENGVNWAFNMLTSYGFDKVDTQGVMVPRWERGTAGSVTFKSDVLQKNDR